MTCHNRREKTLTCLSALYNQNISHGVIFKVYLVDDGCTDGTGDAVREQFPFVRVLEGDGNLYWCGGMHLAWAEAMKGDYDAYLWLNDDTILLSGAIDTMLLTANMVRAHTGKDGIIIGSCRDPDTGTHTYGGLVKRNRRSKLADQPRAPFDDIILADSMNGNLVLIPREVFSILGNLSPVFTHAFGDVDYAYRAKKSGIYNWICPGHQAECARNEGLKPWIDPRTPFRQRWKNYCSPHGLPPRQWYVYVRSHTGIWWPIYFFKPLLRVFFPSLWQLREL